MQVFSEELIFVLAPDVVGELLVGGDVDKHAWVQIASFTFKIPLESLHLLEALVVCDAHLLSLSV